MRVVVFGGSGFVGSAVSRALRAAGCEVVERRAPRLASASRTAPDLAHESRAWVGRNDAFAASLSGADVVVNAAGVADATGTDTGTLLGANALLPAVLAVACEGTGRVSRLVHISSVAVQGRRATLDESRTWQPFSPYSMSKALGEQALLDLGPGLEVVIYRPTSVQGPDRSVTRALHRLAMGRLSSVAGSGANATPQVLVQSAASAVAFLAMTPGSMPAIVMHPWEGMTTRDLLITLSQGQEPRRIPEPAARSLLACLFAGAKVRPSLAAQARRLELLWLGQAQDTSWLTTAGWSTPVGAAEWNELARQLDLSA